MGIFGAMLGILIFSYLLVGLVIFHQSLGGGVDCSEVSIVFLIYILSMLAYYWFYVQDHQYFSDEEQSKFMKVYIMKANQARKNNHLKTARFHHRFEAYLTGSRTNDTSYNNRSVTVHAEVQPSVPSTMGTASNYSEPMEELDSEEGDYEEDHKPEENKNEYRYESRHQSSRYLSNRHESRRVEDRHEKNRHEDKVIVFQQQE